MKHLITDRDLLSGAVGRRIVLDANTLITPSARDRAARLGIEVVEQSGETWHAVAPAVAAACARCGSAACTCAGAGPQLVTGGGHAATLGGLPDGLYLVRVVGGRAQLLPATGPGLMVRAAGAG
ncbi:MAG TPA: hypothetical protein VFY71_15580 [Planctomycetota bacterium]|nr:hypothetical protein [Planctomycetota bacterium]